MKSLEFNEEALAMDIFTKLSALYIKDMLDSSGYSDFSNVDLEEFDKNVEELGILAFRLAKGFRKARLRAFK